MDCWVSSRHPDLLRHLSMCYVSKSVGFDTSPSWVNNLLPTIAMVLWTKDTSADSCSCSEARRSALTALLIGAGFCEQQKIKPPAADESSKNKWYVVHLSWGYDKLRTLSWWDWQWFVLTRASGIIAAQIRIFGLLKEYSVHGQLPTVLYLVIRYPVVSFVYLFLESVKEGEIFQYRNCWLYQGFKHAYHDASGLVATYVMAYDCIVVRAYAYCHLSRYIMSVV